MVYFGSTPPIHSFQLTLSHLVERSRAIISLESSQKGYGQHDIYDNWLAAEFVETTISMIGSCLVMSKYAKDCHFFYSMTSKWATCHLIIHFISCNPAKFPGTFLKQKIDGWQGCLLYLFWGYSFSTHYHFLKQSFKLRRTHKMAIMYPPISSWNTLNSVWFCEKMIRRLKFEECSSLIGT